MAGAPALLVDQTTDLPAEDCAAAGVIAGALRLGSIEVMIPDTRGAAFSQPGAVEHVTREGALVANSRLWIERAIGDHVRLHGSAVPIGERRAPLLIARSRRLDSPEMGDDDGTLRIEVTERDGRLGLLLRGEEAGELRRDDYGRWSIAEHGLARELSRHFCTAVDFSAPPTERPNLSNRASFRLTVIGENAHLREVYPAVLAALGDAADLVDAAPAVTILSPRDASRPDWGRALAQSDGIVLPGGSDLTQVSGQAAAAGEAMARSIPLLGLCLGMQSLSLAVARGQAGLMDADLEETSPEAPFHLFRRLRNPAGRPWHRLGNQRLRLEPGSRLAACYGSGEAVERLNHRFAFNWDAEAPLRRAGLEVSALDAERRIADGIELTRHPFGLGLQGHPELISRQGAPHPVILAFLRAAAVHRAPARN